MFQGHYYNTHRIQVVVSIILVSYESLRNIGYKQDNFKSIDFEKYLESKVNCVHT